VNDKVKILLAEVLQMPLEKISDDLAMNDVEVWDSLKHMELIGSMEQAFGIEFTFEEIVTMKSVPEIRRVLKEKGAIS
jgi:acyl carrier protein